MKRLARMQLATAVIIYGNMDIPISMAMDIATTSLLPMFTDMSTYPFGNFTGATVSYLDALITAMLKHGVNASTGQLSPGIWLGECIDGISTRTLGGKYVGGWARADLHNFLKFLDEHSVRSVDIWTSDGRNKTSCPSPCPSTPTCQWAYEELRARKTGRH